MRNRMLLSGMLIFLLAGQTVYADDLKDAETLIKSKLDRVISSLQQKDLKPEERDRKIIDIVEPVFDFNIMAKLTLGKKYWPGMNKEKRKEFIGLFIERIKGSYLEKLNLFTNERIEYKPAVKEKKRVHVPTDLISKGNIISMLYKLYKAKDGKWYIYDVEIQGVSIIKTYKTQFDQVLGTGTIDDLLKKMRNPETG